MKIILVRGLFALLLLILAIGAFAGYKYYMVFGEGDDVFETVPPALPQMKPNAILIFNKTNGYRDGPGIAAATAALRAIVAKRGWSSFVTENGAVFNAAQLARFKVVVGNNTSGDNLLPAQKAAFRRYVEQGGGFVGIHGAGGDPSYSWRWYVETLIGAQFAGHTLFPQFQRAAIRIEDRTHPATRHLGPTWVRTDEWYSFARSPRGQVHVLATIDERSYRPKMAGFSVAMGADHPVVWTHCVGRGRVFYSALGHTLSSYAEPAYVAMLSGAISWAAGTDGPRCAANFPVD